LAELNRCFNELTRVKVSHLSAEALAALDAEYSASIKPKPIVVPVPGPSKPATAQIPKLSAEEEARRDRWERVIDMARKGRLEALSCFVERHASESDPDWCEDLPNWMDSSTLRSTPTLLHVASAADQTEVVRWLLFDRHADPTKNGSDPPRTAYEVAGARSTRNVFRRCMAERPEVWDWSGAARVPSALTEEQEAEQKAKGTERKNKLRSKMREKEKERADAQKSVEEAEAKQKDEEEQRRKKALADAPSRGGPQKLGGANANVNNTGMAGLTEEQRMRIERERRARAAEARLQRR